MVANPIILYDNNPEIKTQYFSTTDQTILDAKIHPRAQSHTKSLARSVHACNPNARGGHDQHTYYSTTVIPFR